MDSLKAVVKIEINTSKNHNIRAIFSRCGEMYYTLSQSHVISLTLKSDSSLDIYPCSINSLLHTHYFVAFKETANAECAVNLQLDIPEIRVLAIHSNSTLTQQYLNVNPSAIVLQNKHQNQESSSQNIPPFPELQCSPVAKKRKLENYSDCSYPAAQIFANAPLLLPPIRINQLWGNPSPTSRQILAPLKNPASLPKSSSTPLVVTSLESAPSAINFPFTFSTTLTMVLCGEAISYDLEKLESDPRVIIELLKVCSSERASWMIVGAHYRRTGNMKSAIIVMKAFLEAMKTRDISTDRLKPAFLLLSGCETDLAKRAKAENSDPSSHYRGAKYWLQKVYGDTSFGRSLDMRGLSTNSSDCEFKPPWDKSTKLDNLGHLSPADSPVHSTPRLLSRNRVLEREIKTLRGKQKGQRALLTDMRLSNRRLGDDLVYERNMRRKLQRQLAETEKARDCARKLESFALEQIRREVKGRREAEESANAERLMRLEVVTLAENRESQNSIEDIARVLQNNSSVEIKKDSSSSSK